MFKPNRNSKTNYVNPAEETDERNDKSDVADNEDDDPLFADDWGLAELLFPLPSTSTSILTSTTSKREAASSGGRKFQPSPPVTLLVMAVDKSIIFDPSAQELAVADGVLAVTVGYKDVDEGDGSKESSSSTSSSDESSDTTSNSSNNSSSSNDENDIQTKSNTTSQRTTSKISTINRPVRLLSIRTIDPPSRLTHSGLPNALNPATGGTAVPPAHADLIVAKEGLLARTAAVATAAATEGRNGGNNNSGSSGGDGADYGGVWSPPRGGLSRKVVKKMVDEVVKRGGVGEEVLTALEGVVKRN